MVPAVWLMAPAELRSSTSVALTLPASVNPPVLVVSANVLAAPVSLTGPATFSASLLVSAKPAVVVKAPSVPTRLVIWPRLAEVEALPVSDVALIEPADWLIVPAETRLSALVALTLPARVRPPVVVVNARVLAAPVSLTAPLTSSAWLLVSARPAVVAKAPSVPIRLASPSATVEPLPVKVPAVITPEDWLMVPAEARLTVWVALTWPACVSPPVVVVNASVLAAPVSLTGPLTISA